MTQSTKPSEMEATQYLNYISLKRFRDWEKIDTYKTLTGKLEAMMILTGKTRDDLKDIPVIGFDQMYDDATEQLLRTVDYVPMLIKYKDQLLGTNDFKLNTIGEVTDVESMLDGDDIRDIARCMLTPVESTSFTDAEFFLYGTDDSGEEIYVKILEDFEQDARRIKRGTYAASELLPASFFDDFPFDLYASVVDFIRGVAVPSFLEISQNYSPQEAEIQKDSNMEKLMEQIMLVMAGLRRSLILQKLLS